ncbi:hypothetical protein BN7_6605 [Wickerhamomyces ciferrii]|uniref:Uncharacterized protein n=1 Tax=Wickerhamomyces ciferrii (strain ATCC 14091 / BCRC 22168 / CBS 111 / JCM 3599 / NBRC 0793 / NRRL Y-1031 F-60-10) TaxID=1206466 RepID=K0L0M6_WICCF|nr:uncharacterized protein BN7_6605 [Wickerhamomyces ciferrii]CCH46998.1 hypothetical protein BN7_6605 [Wickerhamomyces ciferrii]
MDFTSHRSNIPFFDVYLDRYNQTELVNQFEVQSAPNILCPDSLTYGAYHRYTNRTPCFQQFTKDIVYIVSSYIGVKNSYFLSGDDDISSLASDISQLIIKNFSNLFHVFPDNINFIHPNTEYVIKCLSNGYYKKLKKTLGPLLKDVNETQSARSTKRRKLAELPDFNPSIECQLDDLIIQLQKRKLSQHQSIKNINYISYKHSHGQNINPMKLDDEVDDISKLHNIILFIFEKRYRIQNIQVKETFTKEFLNGRNTSRSYLNANDKKVLVDATKNPLVLTDVLFDNDDNSGVPIINEQIQPDNQPQQSSVDLNLGNEDYYIDEPGAGQNNDDDPVINGIERPPDSEPTDTQWMALNYIEQIVNYYNVNSPFTVDFLANADSYAQGEFTQDVGNSFMNTLDHHAKILGLSSELTASRIKRLYPTWFDELDNKDGTSPSSSDYVKESIKGSIHKNNNEFLKSSIINHVDKAVSSLQKLSRPLTKFTNAQEDLLKDYGLLQVISICKNKCGTNYKKEAEDGKEGIWLCSICMESNDVRDADSYNYVSIRTSIAALFKNIHSFERICSNINRHHTASDQSLGPETPRSFYNSMFARMMKGKMVKGETSDGETHHRIIDGRRAKYYEKDVLNLSLVLSLDGIELDKANSIWPVAISIIDNGEQYYQKDNEMHRSMAIPLFSLPNNYQIDEFFNVLYDDLCHLSTNGMYVMNPITNTPMKVFATLVCCCGDMPAQAKLTSSSNAVGLSFCRFCSKLKRVYTSKELKNGKTKYKLRDINEEFNNINLMDIEGLSNLEATRGKVRPGNGSFTDTHFNMKPKNGGYRLLAEQALKENNKLSSLLGFSKINNFHKFELAIQVHSGIVMDPMHNVLEGLASRIVSVITNDELVDKNLAFDKQTIANINQFIIKKNYNTFPTSFGEMMKSFAEIKKAEMYISLVLLLVPIIFEEFPDHGISKKFVSVINKFKHIMVFCFRFNITQKEKSKIYDLTTSFITEYEKIFDSHGMRNNVTVALHETHHLAALTNTFGPLAMYNTFANERLVGSIKSSYHGRATASKSVNKKEISLFNHMQSLKNALGVTDFKEMSVKAKTKIIKKTLPVNLYQTLDNEQCEALSESICLHYENQTEDQESDANNVSKLVGKGNLFLDLPEKVGEELMDNLLSLLLIPEFNQESHPILSHTNYIFPNNTKESLRINKFMDQDKFFMRKTFESIAPERQSCCFIYTKELVNKEQKTYVGICHFIVSCGAEVYGLFTTFNNLNPLEDSDNHFVCFNIPKGTNGVKKWINMEDLVCLTWPVMGPQNTSFFLKQEYIDPKPSTVCIFEGTKMFF